MFILQGTYKSFSISIVLCAVLFLGSMLFMSPETLATELLLAKNYSGQEQVTGWVMSEKLDGVRGYWNGSTLASKNGKPFSPPDAFIASLPPFPLEGELWAGRGNYEQTLSIVTRKQPHDEWLKLQFAIFDVPEHVGQFTERIKVARQWFAEHPTNYAFVIQQSTVHDREHLLHELQRIEDLGGEGLIVRNPAAVYSAGRSSEILKVKSYQDTEAKVVAHLPGKGRNTGRLGALLVRLDDGTEFKIGTGFTDAERESPPPPGAVVTFKYYGKYQSGIPVFPSFLRIRAEKDL